MVEEMSLRWVQIIQIFVFRFQNEICDHGGCEIQGNRQLCEQQMKGEKADGCAMHASLSEDESPLRSWMSGKLENVVVGI